MTDSDEGRGARGEGSPLERWLVALLDSAPSFVFVKDLEFRYRFVSRRFTDFGPTSVHEVIGLTDHDYADPAAAEWIRSEEARALAADGPVEAETEVPTPVGPRWFHSLKFPVRDASGAVIGIGGIVTDVTERRRREAEQVAEHERTLARKESELRRLTTPLLPIADGVLVMPLVGTIDPARAAEMLESLLQGITGQRARIAIVDVTGVREVDAAAAAAIVAAARAARLVGAEVVLTGIGPAVAAALVELGVDLAGVTTLGTLAAGIQHALGR